MNIEQTGAEPSGIYVYTKKPLPTPIKTEQAQAHTCLLKFPWDAE